jgi:hypothetical protein
MVRLIVVAILLSSSSVHAQEKKPRIRVGKDTTVFLGPLNDSGYVDFAAALDQRMKKGVTPATNANAELRKLLGFEGISSKYTSEYFAALGIPVPDADEQFYVPMTNRNELDSATNRPWKVEELPDAAEWLERNNQLLAKVRSAVARPHYYTPLVPQDGRVMEILLPDIQHSREFARLLAADAMLSLESGDEAGALDNSLAMYRLSSHVGNGWTLIELLVSYAIRRMALNVEIEYLQSVQPSAAKRKFWQRKLKSVPKLRTVSESVDIGERFTLLDIVSAVAQNADTSMIGGMLGEEIPDLTAAEALLLKVRLNKPAFDFNRIMIATNKHCDQMVAVLKIADPEKRKAGFELIRKRQLMAKEGVKRIKSLGTLTDRELEQVGIDFIVGLASPSIERVREAELKMQGQQDVVDIAWALSAWSAAGNQWPTELSELVPKYLPSVPNNRLTNKPVRYAVDGKSCELLGPAEDFRIVLTQE